MRVIWLSWPSRVLLSQALLHLLIAGIGVGQVYDWEWIGVSLGRWSQPDWVSPTAYVPFVYTFHNPITNPVPPPSH